MKRLQIIAVKIFGTEKVNVILTVPGGETELLKLCTQYIFAEVEPIEPVYLGDKNFIQSRMKKYITTGYFDSTDDKEAEERFKEFNKMMH